MQNEAGPKQPPRSPDDLLNGPKPPGATQAPPEVQDNFTKAEGQDEAVVILPSYSQVPERIQDNDWNNGKPESTREETDTLPAHKAGEALKDESLPGNEENKHGDNPGGMDKEVIVDQNSG